MSDPVKLIRTDDQSRRYGARGADEADFWPVAGGAFTILGLLIGGHRYNWRVNHEMRAQSSPPTDDWFGPSQQRPAPETRMIFRAGPAPAPAPVAAKLLLCGPEEGHQVSSAASRAAFGSPFSTYRDGFAPSQRYAVASPPMPLARNDATISAVLTDDVAGVLRHAVGLLRRW